MTTHDYTDLGRLVVRAGALGRYAAAIQDDALRCRALKRLQKVLRQIRHFLKSQIAQLEDFPVILST